MSSPEKPVKIQPIYQGCETNKFRYKNASRSTLSQVVATLIQNWLLIDLGMQLVMPTIVLGAIHNNPAEDLSMNDEQASWFGSILFFAHPIGSMVSGFLQEQFGRKGSLILVNIPIFAAWSTLYLAGSIYMLYFVSLAMGLSVGFCEAPLHSYIGEVGEPHLRGTLSTVTSAACILGMLIMYIIGYLVHWRTAALISSAVPVITIIFMTQIPESPTWLIMKDRLKDAQKSLSWLRGWVEPEEVQEEFQELLSYTKISPPPYQANDIEIEKYELVRTDENGREVAKEKESYLEAKFRELTDKKLLRPLRMVFIVFVFCYASSLIAMRPYMVGVFNEFGFPMDSKLILILTSAFFFVGSILNVVLLRRLGKRRLTLLCQGMASVSIVLLGVYCSFFDRTNRIPSLVWVPISLLVSISFFSGLSVALLPWQLLSEVFPLKGRGAAGGISAAWAYYVGAVMSKTYLYLERWIKLNGVLFFYGAISLIGFWYFLRYLPETEGKSLEKIESYFTKNHDKKEKFSKPKRSKKPVSPL
ncbi:unnamed protein product [Bemisia tabaci]|uniref:Major facilitator superfamily (MFS) profile domain-containing protein n=1 Tax=Bemisia tabaci TaxID=7038 RepID=A0A9P0A1K7_BEMTA|nr:unnamed protein product [Bemisia tabaci]